MTIQDLYSIFFKFPIICTDSRKIIKDCLFFALKGENFDGAKFAGEAIDKGAAFAIIDNCKYAKGKQFICVDNVLKTLQELANYHRNHFDIPVLGITGTNGKTTTKELIAKILATSYNIVATKGNLNNHIGLPLMLLQITNSTEIAVLEMGASKRGDIKELCNIANPTLGLITNIGTAHIEGFGSLENLYHTKKELFDSVITNQGTIFFNKDYSYFKSIDYIKSITYGTSENTIIRGKILNSDLFLKLAITLNNNIHILETKFIGKYNFENILAAVSVGHFFNIPIQKAIEAISCYIPDNNRSQLIETGRNKIISDAYNANPTSMMAAISNFMSIAVSIPKTLILGDMLELGKISSQEHQNIVKQLENMSFEKIFLVGNLFFKTQTKSSAFLKFLSTEELKNYLNENPITGNMILIKGSRGIALENIIKLL